MNDDTTSPAAPEPVPAAPAPAPVSSATPDTPAAGIPAAIRGVSPSPVAADFPVEGDGMAERIDALFHRHLANTPLSADTQHWNLIQTVKQEIKKLLGLI